MIYKTNNFFTEQNGKHVNNKDPNSFMFGVKCDGCGEDFGDWEFDPCLAPYEDEILSRAEDEGWARIDGLHYCPHCCEYDEEKEEFVVVKRENATR